MVLLSRFKSGAKFIQSFKLANGPSPDPEGLKSVDYLRQALSLLTSDEHLLRDLYRYNPYAKNSFEEIKKEFKLLENFFGEK